MSKKNLFKGALYSLVALMAVAFVACSDSDADEIQVPQLTAEPTTIALSDDESRATVEITANCGWKVNAPDWLDVSPAAGEGNAVIELSVDPETVKTSQSGTVTFTMISAQYGEWGKADSKIKVSYTYQGEEPVNPSEATVVYSNNFDKEEATKTYGTSGGSWPYLDQFEGWKNEEGEGAASVSYTFSGMSARANSASNGNYSDYEGSGMNNLFFGKSAYITIEKITLDSNKLQLTFGSEKYLTDGDSNFVNDEMQVTLSNDGTNWSDPITYSFPAGANIEGTWNLATADFTLPEGTTTLYIKFAASVASAYRLDDVKLCEGNGGQEVTFDNQGESPVTPSEVVKATVAEFLAAAEDATIYELTGEITSVTNETYGNFYLKDDTGEVLIYGLCSPTGEQKYWAESGVKVGDTITVQTIRSSYNGTPQGKNAIYVSHETGQGGDDPSPVVPAEGPYASDAPFVCDGDSYSNPAGLGETTIDGSAATGFKLGTGKVSGVYTSTAVGVEGDKYLNFYAVAWKDKSATLYVRVDGTQVGAFELAGNAGATSNPPFNALTPADTDHYSVKLTGLTASSVVEFSTSDQYAIVNDASSGRAIVFGVKLTDEALAPEQGGGDEPTPSEVIKATVAEFLAAAEDATQLYELTGEITSVTNETYGNFYLKDDTGEVLIYGLCSPTGEQKYWAESGVKVGDTITVQTIRSSYNDTPQGKNAIYVSHVAGEGTETPVNPGEGSNEIEILFSNYFSEDTELATAEGATYTFGDFDFTFTKVNTSGTSKYNANDPGIRYYQNDILKIDGKGKTITKIVFTTYGSKPGPLAPDTGTFDDATTTWTGSAETITFTATKQMRMSKVVITVE